MRHTEINFFEGQYPEEGSQTFKKGDATNDDATDTTSVIDSLGRRFAESKNPVIKPTNINSDLIEPNDFKQQSPPLFNRPTKVARV